MKSETVAASGGAREGRPSRIWIPWALNTTGLPVPVITAPVPPVAPPAIP